MFMNTFWIESPLGEFCGDLCLLFLVVHFVSTFDLSSALDPSLHCASVFDVTIEKCFKRLRVLNSTIDF